MLFATVVRTAIVVALLALPSLASARPITVGAAVGRTQSKVDANGDANDTIGLFGRLGFSRRVSGQLELQKFDFYDAGTVVRSVTGLIVVDLGHSGRLYPTMSAGYGFERASDPYGSEASGTHIEGGFGLEYRADGGLVIGADLRLGGRTIENQYEVQPLYSDGGGTGSIALYSPQTLQSGEYRSGRLFAAIRF